MLILAIASSILSLTMSNLRPATLKCTLESCLRTYRTEQAYIRAIPAHTIFCNTLLASLASKKPRTPSALKAIRGMGPKRCQSYGSDILHLINIHKNGVLRPEDALRTLKSYEPIAAKPQALTRLTRVKRARKLTKKTARSKHQTKFSDSKLLESKAAPRRPRPRPRPRPKPFGQPALNQSLTNQSEMPAPASPRQISVSSPLAPLAMDASLPLPLLPSPRSRLLDGLNISAFSPAAAPSSSAAEPPPPGQWDVYILELEGGRVYVGASRDVNRRIAQHVAGTGSAYTRAYKPTGVRLPRLGNVAGTGDAAERDETLRYMQQRGIPYVRGWRFSQVSMSTEEFAEAEANIRELFNLCRRCGYHGHFINRCRATYDRWGMQCGGK